MHRALEPKPRRNRVWEYGTAHATMLHVLRGHARERYKAAHFASMYSGHLQDAAAYYWRMYRGVPEITKRYIKLNQPLTPM